MPRFGIASKITKAADYNRRRNTMTNKVGGSNGNHEQAKHRRGPSSYWMHDSEVVFDSLGLKPGDCFLDLGCGPGDYSIRASRILGESGFVYALDKTQNMIEALKTEAHAQGLINLRAIAANITEPLPVGDNCIDVCLIATVVHIPVVSKRIKTLFNEIIRVLKPGGRLAIIECKKEDMPFGPPKHLRWCPTDIENSLQSHGVEKLGLVDLGYNYMIQFAVKELTGGI